MQRIFIFRKSLLLLFLCLLSFLAFSGVPPSLNTTDCGNQFRIVVLGSSTAYGKGASPIDSSWVNRYTAYVKSKNSQSTVINLAVPGYTTYHILCPNNFIPPAGRPSPDTSKNITKALSLQPDAIIINVPTNDVGNGYSLAEIKSNYERTMALAKAKNIPVWVSTSQPRTNFNQAERDSLKVLRDWTYTRFGVYAVDFWSTVANSDGTINSFYSSGDGVHVNNAGHRLFYSRMVNERILDSLCLRKAATPTKYVKVNINGGTNPYNNASWNNWPLGTVEKTNTGTIPLKYSDGSSSTISAWLSHTLSVGDNGALYSTTISSKMAPSEVLRHATYSAQTRTLTIKGLSASKKYNLELYNSWAISNNTTILIVNGVTQTINVFNNYTQKGLFTNLSPDVNGQIVVTLKSGTTYNHLNGFMLIEQGSDYPTASIVRKGTILEEKNATRIASNGKDHNVFLTSIKVYPNPARDRVLVNLIATEAGRARLFLYDSQGMVVGLQQASLHIGRNQLELNMGGFVAGTYSLSVKWSGNTKVVQIIKL